MGRAWHFAIATTCYAVVTLLGAGFYRNIMFHTSQHWDIASMFESLGKALYTHELHLSQV